MDALNDLKALFTSPVVDPDPVMIFADLDMREQGVTIKRVPRLIYGEYDLGFDESFIPYSVEKVLVAFSKDFRNNRLPIALRTGDEVSYEDVASYYKKTPEGAS